MTCKCGEGNIYKKPYSTINTVHLLQNKKASAVSVCCTSLGIVVVRYKLFYVELYLST